MGRLYLIVVSMEHREVLSENNGGIRSLLESRKLAPVTGDVASNLGGSFPTQVVEGRVMDNLNRDCDYCS